MLPLNLITIKRLSALAFAPVLMFAHVANDQNTVHKSQYRVQVWQENSSTAETYYADSYTAGEDGDELVLIIDDETFTVSGSRITAERVK
jgi:hypothetical protein